MLIFNCRLFVKETLTGKMPLHACSEGVLIACAIAWSCGVVRFEETPMLTARFFAKFRWRRFSKVMWPAKATPGVFKFSYLRNFCRYFLYNCLTKRMKIILSENKIRFKVIQKVRAQLGVSTNFLTVPRTSLIMSKHGEAKSKFGQKCVNNRLKQTVLLAKEW